MLLLITLLLLASVPDSSLEEDEEEEVEEEITGSGISRAIQKEIIDRHNEIRRNVTPSARDMLKMVWDDKIGERARKWAEKCTLTMSPQKERQTNDSFCGEIVFQANYVNSWTEVIAFWNQKKTNFKYGVGAIDPDLNVYPYTQMIWYSSYRVGCAATYCPGTEFPYFYVCQYCPAGNFQEKIAKPYKKGRPCGACKKHCEDKLCTNPCKHTDVANNCKDMKKTFTCKNSLVRKNCQATCSCRGTIL